MSQIVWLASYPKSGNTWLRAFLASFQRDNGMPVDINALAVGPIASDRNLFDCALGVESSDMTEEEVERYRSAACRHLALRSASPLYLKIHDAYVLTCAGEPLIPADVSQGAIYVVRNPLDVAISFARHLNRTVEEAVDRMALASMSLAGNRFRLSTQLRQRILSWSGHVASWLDQHEIPVHVMRYEDMSLRPFDAFVGAVRFLGRGEDIARVHRAVTNSSFGVLQQQEQTSGFVERPPGTKAFFWKGRTGTWREVLTEEQVARVIRDHGEVMRRLGYLSGSGRVEGV